MNIILEGRTGTGFTVSGESVMLDKYGDVYPTIDNLMHPNPGTEEDEYSEIKNHPTIGAHILSNATLFKDIIPIVKHHHEHYDGSGYPDKLKGEEIPLLARIIAITDAYDSMVSNRAYTQ